jgi:hypothetical protein
MVLTWLIINDYIIILLYYYIIILLYYYIIILLYYYIIFFILTKNWNLCIYCYIHEHQERFIKVFSIYKIFRIINIHFLYKYNNLKWCEFFIKIQNNNSYNHCKILFCNLINKKIQWIIIGGFNLHKI